MNVNEFDPVNETVEEPMEEVVEEAVEEVDAAEPIEEVMEEAAEETEETVETFEEAPVQQPKKKNNAVAIAVIAVLAVILAVGMFFALKMLFTAPSAEETVEQGLTIEAEAHHTNAHGYPSWSIHYHTHEGETGIHYSYLDETGTEITLSSDEVNTLMNEVVATVGAVTMDNRALQYYYSDDLMTFINTYYNYIGSLLDMNAPLDEQINNNAAGGQDTWQKTMLEASLNRFHLVAAMKQEAEKNNYEMKPDEQDYLNSLKDLETMAMYYGYPDALSLVKDMLGPMATVESYCAYVEDTLISSFYSAHLAESIEITDEEINSYYDANAEVYEQQNILKNDENVVDVRHILIQPETAEDGSMSDEAWAAAEEEANRILKEWQDGEATEGTFGNLADNYSSDPGSNGTQLGSGGSSGGLYEAVYPNQMVPEFDAWCFDEARQPGDTGIVKTTYGYHIMYFVKEGDYIHWQKVCEDALRTERVTEIRDELLLNYEPVLETGKMILLDTSTATTPSETEETKVTVTEQ